MPELRDVLRQGADVTTGLPDMPAMWSRAVRERRLRRLARSAAVAAAVGVVAALGSVVAAGPRPPEPAVTPQLPSASPLPEFPGPLRAGETYEAAAVGLPYGFTTPGPGWAMAAREPGWLSLHRGGARVNLQQWDGVYDPAPDADPRVLDVPADLLGWLTSHSRLRVGDQRTITLADQQWREVDLSVRVPLATPPPECAGTPCVLLGHVGAESVELLASERAALYLPMDSGETTVILVAAPTSSSTAWTAAISLVSSLHERPSP